MSFKVPKFEFPDLSPSKPAKFANSTKVEENFSNLSKISYVGVPESNTPQPPAHPSQYRDRVLTCYDCGYFRAAINSPNPTQAWGHCRKQGRGRYGAAMACEIILTVK